MILAVPVWLISCPFIGDFIENGIIFLLNLEMENIKHAGIPTVLTLKNGNGDNHLKKLK
jgi:hypothetical protein